MTDTLDRVRQARTQLAQARTEFDAAILAASESGHSLRTIAAAAQMSNPGVLKLLRRLRQS